MRLLEREAQAMMRAGVAATVGAPSLCPLPAAAALTVKDMGMLNPARFLRYLAAQAARNGVKIYEGSVLPRWKPTWSIPSAEAFRRRIS